MSAGTSPITGIIDENLVILEFGQYEGRTVKELAEIDSDFYQRIASEKTEGIYSIRRHRDKTFRLYLNPLSDVTQ